MIYFLYNYMDLYNKYLPKKIEDYYLHPDLQDFLFSLRNKDLPNLILYGQPGCGKKSLLSCLFPEPKTKTIRSIKYNSKNINYTIYNSKHTIEIDSKELKIYNKYLLQKVIKHIAETKRVKDNKSKIIIIYNADFLDKEFQYILRKMIELYVYNATFIMITNSLSKIIKPVKSRCLCIRISNPTQEQIFNFLKNVKEKEKLKIPTSKLNKIVNNSNRNLKKALLNLELYRYNNNLKIDCKISKDIDKILSTMNNKTFNIKLIEIWETKLYNLIINFSIEDKTIIKLLFDRIIKLNNDINFKKEVLNITLDYDERITKGSKSIIHLNNYLAIIYKIVRKFKEV